MRAPVVFAVVVTWNRRALLEQCLAHLMAQTRPCDGLIVVDNASDDGTADMLADALQRITFASKSIGIAAVLVHAKDDAARRFYLRCAEFIEYPQDSRTTFLPIETVLAAFG